MTPLSFEYFMVPPTPPEIHQWEFYNKSYLFNPTMFTRDIDKQMRILETIATDIGLGTKETPKILEAVEPKVKLLRRYIGLQKAPGVAAKMKAELAAGEFEKMVVFGVHRDFLEELQNGLRDVGVLKLYAGTPMDKRDDIAAKFKSGKTPFLACQITAAGTAVDLTGSCECVFAEADWKPLNNLQALMRLWYAEQTKPVRCRFIGMEGSIDDRLQRAMRNTLKAMALGQNDGVNIFEE